MQRYDAILFDLLTALIDSWSLWNQVAGSEAAGREWRAEYLRLTYGCGAYRAYEDLIVESARLARLPDTLAGRLESAWDELQPWEDAIELLADLAPRYRLGLVTNCSERLGRRAAARLGVRFDSIVTAERAGFYKPDPRPYRMALRELGVSADRTVFVAGSGFDLIGTGRVGLQALWHNRVGLEAPAGAPAPIRQASALRPMVDDFLLSCS